MPSKKATTIASAKRTRSAAKPAAAQPRRTRAARPGAERTLARPAGTGKPDGASTITPEERRMLIARTAYLRAERRGFVPGHELEDWAAAEAEVDAQLAGGTASD
jgi:hypothetical protein